jgi:hypothetical protein
MKLQFVGTVCGLLLTASTAGAGDQAKDRKPPTETTSPSRVAVPRVEQQQTQTQPKIVFSAEQIRLIKTHYESRYVQLPPGLQKKYARTGQLPPGWQKKMEPFPASLERSFPTLAAPYRRGVIDGQAVIYNSQVGTIIDVAVLF